MEHGTFFMVIAILAIALEGLRLALLFFEPGLKYKIAEPLKAKPDTEEFLCILESVTDAKVRTRSKTTVLPNGENFYEANLEEMRKAQHSINVEAYIFSKGKVADSFIKVMAERARAGVNVKLVIDSIGSMGTRTSYFKELLDAGGRVEWYHGFKWHLLPRLNNRTHRELTVIDGRVAFIGGAGFADHWLHSKKDHKRWRDTMVRVEGDAVTSLQATFAENWLEATGELLVGDEYFPNIEHAKESALLIVNSTPSAGQSTRGRILFQTLLASAQESISVTSPYFLPDASARREMVRALQRGVKVKILVPGKKSDHMLTRSSSRRLYGELLKAGAEIHEYMPAMIHAKVMIIDGLWSVVGSTNFDNRSFGINDEVNMAACEKGLARELTKHFDEDLEESRQITLKEWKHRSVFERMHEALGWMVERQE